MPKMSKYPCAKWSVPSWQKTEISAPFKTLSDKQNNIVLSSKKRMGGRAAYEQQDDTSAYKALGDTIVDIDIPGEIGLKINELAQVASRSKIVTIASSPCFIVQSRAIQYIKRLLTIMKGL